MGGRWKCNKNDGIRIVKQKEEENLVYIFSFVFFFSLLPPLSLSQKKMRPRPCSPLPPSHSLSDQFPSSIKELIRHRNKRHQKALIEGETSCSLCFFVFPRNRRTRLCSFSFLARLLFRGSVHPLPLPLPRSSSSVLRVIALGSKEKKRPERAPFYEEKKQTNHVDQNERLDLRRDAKRPPPPPLVRLPCPPHRLRQR